MALLVGPRSSSASVHCACRFTTSVIKTLFTPSSIPRLQPAPTMISTLRATSSECARYSRVQSRFGDIQQSPDLEDLGARADACLDLMEPMGPARQLGMGGRTRTSISTRPFDASDSPWKLGYKDREGMIMTCNWYTLDSGLGFVLDGRNIVGSWSTAH